MKRLFVFLLAAVLLLVPAFGAPAAKIGDTEYATLQDAVNAVQRDECIVLLEPVTEPVTVNMAKEDFTVCYAGPGLGDDLTGIIVPGEHYTLEESLTGHYTVRYDSGLDFSD